MTDDLNMQENGAPSYLVALLSASVLAGVIVGAAVALEAFARWMMT